MNDHQENINYQKLEDEFFEALWPPEELMSDFMKALYEEEGIYNVIN